MIKRGSEKGMLKNLELCGIVIITLIFSQLFIFSVNAQKEPADLSSPNTSILWNFLCPQIVSFNSNSMNSVMNAALSPREIDYLQDIDSDSVKEVIIGTELPKVTGTPQNPKASIMAVSGKTGSLLWSKDYAPADYIRIMKITADKDGDGTSDIIAVLQNPYGSAKPKSKVVTISGKTGVEIAYTGINYTPNITNAVSVTPSLLVTQDLDQDGIQDTVVINGNKVSAIKN